jgi:cytochrome c biogenesis protein CcmG/thiol:disulfide interchange protein DsbE
MNRLLLIPLLVFIALAAFLLIGLFRDPHEVPSPLLNKPAPAFQLGQLENPNKTFSAQEMRGKVWLLNVYASWCVSCRDEHPVLLKLSREGDVPIYGLDWKDKPEDARAWLSELGNPYVLSASDLDGRVAIDYGVYGAPETYLIDKQGVIRYKQIGPLCEPMPDGSCGVPSVWTKTILPLIKKLNK